MQKFDELVSYFNRKVSEMEIGTSYKMELLGMVTALGYAHEKETEERKAGRWIRRPYDGIYCTACGKGWSFMLGAPGDIENYHYCPNCGAKMRKESETDG